MMHLKFGIRFLGEHLSDTEEPPHKSSYKISFFKINLIQKYLRKIEMIFITILN